VDRDELFDAIEDLLTALADQAGLPAELAAVAHQPAMVRP
jgi:hypothetical protein